MAAVLFISAAAVFAVVYQDTGTQLRSQIDQEILGDTGQFAQSLPTAGRASAAAVARVADRYVKSDRYRGTGELLFAFVPGQRPVSNHLEVFNNLEFEPGESQTEQLNEDAMSRRLMQLPSGFTTRQVPDAGMVRIYTQRVRSAGVPVTVAAGEPLVTVARAQHSVARAFLIAGAIALVLALASSYLAGERVSAPLRQMATVARRVDAGDLAPRMETSAARSGEVRVLAESFNLMLDRLSEAFSSQRAFVADASHELRTPLTVIRGQLEVLAAQANPAPEEIQHVERLVHAEISRISRLVDDLLFLAQAERGDFLRPETVELRPFVSDLWDGLSRTADRRFELSEIPDGHVVADPDRLAQAIRNLVRNAIEQTADGTGLIRLETTPLPGNSVRFTVIDNGPGIPASERERVFERFHRVDSSRSRRRGGTGLGLAIVKAITEAHGGAVSALENGHPGARMEIVLPRYESD